MRSPVRELEARVHQAKTAGECLAALLDLANLHAAEFRNREGLRSAREAVGPPARPRMSHRGRDRPGTRSAI